MIRIYKNNIIMDRRDFLQKTAKLGLASAVAPAFLTACSKKSTLTPLRNPEDYYLPQLTDKAVEGRELKVGIVGCGGRGQGALYDLLEAADGIRVTAMGDLFADKVQDLRAALAADKQQEVAEDQCFVGFDAYKKVIDSGVDMVVLTTPPVFRATHFQYATEKGVHSFLEKPIAVDAVGYRSIIATARQAQAKKLSVVTGTQRRHQRSYVAAFEKIQQGMIGQITGGQVYWNGGMLWYRTREEAWSDMEWMVRDWVNWKWLSGDHIVEQHVHNIDVFNWMTGQHPVSASAFGARHRRVTGDQFDQFSVDFEYPNGVHLHSMCRQINGCSCRISEFIEGTKGRWDSESNEIKDLEGNVLWKWDEEAAQQEFKQHNPYVLEHADWVSHIRRGEAHEEATATAESSLCAVMGRESAYTGRTITWDDISASPLNYLPEHLELGPVDMSGYTVPTPGE